MRELGDREDVDEVEEQLEEGDAMRLVPDAPQNLHALVGHRRHDTLHLDPPQEHGVQLTGYREFSHEDDRGRSYPVHHRGSGPPVVIIHELAGISPMLTSFADRVVDRGFSVYLPALIPRRKGPTRLLASTIQVCVSAEFTKLATNTTSPVVSWLRSLSRRLHDESGASVGVVGMCLTGGFALAMAIDDHVVTPVVAHPALPFGLGSRRRADLGLDRKHLATLKERSDLRILGCRFSSDLIAPAPRFDRLQAEFGERFTRLEVPSGEASRSKKDGPVRFSKWDHSVLNNVRLQSSASEDAAARSELERVVESVLDFLSARLAADPT